MEEGGRGGARTHTSPTRAPERCSRSSPKSAPKDDSASRTMIAEGGRGASRTTCRSRRIRPSGCGRSSSDWASRRATTPPGGWSRSSATTSACSCSEVEKLATWAGGEPIGPREVELLAVPVGARRRPGRSLTLGAVATWRASSPPARRSSRRRGAVPHRGATRCSGRTRPSGTGARDRGPGRAGDRGAA